MPPHKDERFDEDIDTRVSREDRVRGTDSQGGDKPTPLRQPRNLPQRDEDPHGDFYSDEHPEIPKIRRASLYLDSHRFSADHPATRASGVDTGHVRSVPPVQ